MKRKEIDSLKSRFEECAARFSESLSDLKEAPLCLHDVELILAAEEVGKCRLIADLLGDGYLWSWSMHMVDELNEIVTSNLFKRKE